MILEPAELIAQTVAQLGLDAPAQKSDSVSVTLKDGTVIWIEAVNDGQRIVAWNELLRWPGEAEEAGLFENLLRLHAFGTATHGAAFAANREAGRVIVFKSFPTARLSPDWLAEELQTLVALIDQVQEYSRSNSLAGETPDPEQAETWPRTFA